MNIAVAQPEQETTAPPLCDHCGLEVPPALREEQVELQFCCSGCRVAYEVINDCGLEDFYSVRESAQRGKQRSSGVGGDYAAFDCEAFLEKHATQTSSGLMAIELRLEGVHCAACVWLVEQLPSVVDGVIEARLSLTSCSVRLAWDPSQTNLSAVAAALDRLGYAPHPARDISARDARLATERRQLTRMAIAGALAGNNMLIALGLYAGVFDGIDPAHARLLRWVSMIIGWLSIAWPGSAFFRSAWVSLRSHTPSLDQPIALALGAGLVAGTVNVILDRGEIFFDSLSVLVFLLLVGRFLQARQQRWVTDSVGMAVAMTPDSCRVLREGEYIVESVEALQPGDTVEVMPGEVFPADGVIASGRSSIDASLLTGESIPSPISIGDEVYSGAVNLGGVVRVHVNSVGEQTRVGRLQNLVMQGLEARTPLIQFTDRIGRGFLLVVIAIATLNAVAWALYADMASAIDTTVAVLIVACPCALGLATPLTMALAIARASRDGVLIKSADVFERLARVTPNEPGLMMLDKTGTLTRREMEVVSWEGDCEVIGAVAAMERQSNHPIGQALIRYAEGLEMPSAVVEDCQTEHGHGVSGAWNNQEMLVGSPDWVAQQAMPTEGSLQRAIDAAARKGCSCVVIALDRKVIAVAALSDQPHRDLKQSLGWLRSQGWRLRVMSGDHQPAVEALCSQVGIQSADALSRMTPESKFDAVRDATQCEDNLTPKPVVAMVGDGVNDAAALAAADVGVAVHGGAEAALAAADVYLSRPGIGEVVGLTRLAKRTVRTVRRNLAISLSYNALAITLAAMGYITPLTAALLMPLSSATVLSSAILGVAGNRSTNPQE